MKVHDVQRSNGRFQENFFHEIHGDNCYLGVRVTILGPVKIGNNVTIGGGSVEVKDIPDNCIVAGNPAKIIKYKIDRNDEPT